MSAEYEKSLNELVAETLDVERSVAQDLTLPKTKRQAKLFDELDKLLNKQFENQTNDN